MALERAVVFCATCGVMRITRRLLTKSRVSYALSPPRVTRRYIGRAVTMLTAASRSAYPVACVTFARTTRPCRFSISACPRKHSLVSIPGVVRRRRLRRPLLLEALLPCPRLDERAVDGEVLVRQQVSRPGLRQHALEERLGDVALEQPLTVLGEHRGIPDRVVHVQSDEPAEQEVVVELLHQHPLAAHSVENLKEQRPQQLLGGDRRPAEGRIDRLEAWRHLLQHRVYHGADRPEWMVPGDPLFRGDVAEHASVELVVSTHRHLHRRVETHPTTSIDPKSRKMTTFSAAC